MKKLLSVSILAMIAVSPLAAQAAPTVIGSISIPEIATTENVTNGVATTNYVKGAYNALRAPVNDAVSAMNVSGLTTVAEGETAHYITAGTGVGENLKALDTAARAHQDKIGAGAIANTGALAGYNSDLTTAVNQLNSQLGDSGTASKVSDTTHNYVKRTNTVGENLGVLDDAIGKVALESDTNTIIKNTYQTQGGETTLTNTVSVNLVKLDTALRQEITDRTTKIGTVSNAKLNNNASVGTNLDTLATNIGTIETNTTVIASDLLGDNRANYIATGADVAENLKTLNAQLVTVTEDLAAAGTASSIGTGHNYVGSDHLTGEGQNTVANNIIALDNAVKDNADHIGNATDGLTGTNESGVTDLVTAINNVDNKVLTVYSGWNAGGEPGVPGTVGRDNGFANANPASTPNS